MGDGASGASGTGARNLAAAGRECGAGGATVPGQTCRAGRAPGRPPRSVRATNTSVDRCPTKRRPLCDGLWPTDHTTLWPRSATG